eukprot:SAG31_NODE_520_length_14616_cov_8.879005_4_plen_92_part_00
MSTDTNAAATKKPSPSALKTGEALDHDEFFKSKSPAMLLTYMPMACTTREPDNVADEVGFPPLPQHQSSLLEMLPLANRVCCRNLQTASSI